jgi:S1-C subfamily serine protease
MVNMLHRSCLADHVVLQVGISDQTLILAFERGDVANILDRDRGDRRNCGYQLQVVFIEAHIGNVSVQINYAQRVAVSDQRHAQERSRVRGHQAVSVQRLTFFRVTYQEGSVVFHHAPDDGGAHRDFLGWTKDAIEPEDGTELRGRLIVTRVTPGGPGEKAGLHRGDVIVSVNGEQPKNLADFYRKVWAQGGAGTAIALDVLQGDALQRFTVQSINRLDNLKLRSTF